MKNHKILNNIPEDWTEVSQEELEGLGLVKSEDFKLIGSFFTNGQIIFFHEYPEIPNFLEELKEAYLDLFIHDKTSSKRDVTNSVFVEMGEFKDQKFLFYISNVEGGHKLSMQIFCQNEDGNFGVVTAIDYDKSLSFDKLTKIPHVNQILNLFI